MRIAGQDKQGKRRKGRTNGRLEDKTKRKKKEKDRRSFAGGRQEGNEGREGQRKRKEKEKESRKRRNAAQTMKENEEKNRSGGQIYTSKDKRGIEG